jgi:tRNA nucleotidyltransferase (CCA-adding enzyme)
MTQEEKESYKLERGKYPSAYQAFKMEPDHTLGVESDLQRRDFTINAMAQDHMGNTIDPHGGKRDIKNKVIRMVSIKNFSEDPLRMLRGVQFASRFGFKIESKTFEAIRKNAESIKGIPGERILLEIGKIVTKGDQLLGAKLLCETNLWQEISNLSCKDHNQNAHLFSLSNNSKTIAEFLFLMIAGVASLDEAFKLTKRLKCEIITEKQIKGLYYAWDNEENPHMVVFKLNKIHPSCLNLLVLPENIKMSISSDMPKSVKEIDISGNDLMGLGYKGEAISQVFDSILNKIFSGTLTNSKEEILNYLSNIRDLN